MTTVMSDKVLPILVAALAASLVGALVGLWLGATTEQSALVTILGRANLSEDCRQQIDRAVAGIIEEHEGAPSAPSP
jgi:hypothetical protein